MKVRPSTTAVAQTSDSLGIDISEIMNMMIMMMMVVMMMKMMTGAMEGMNV